ncbi:MAG: LysM domain-containing protein [Acidimicrobiales bacterium]
MVAITAHPSPRLTAMPRMFPSGPLAGRRQPSAVARRSLAAVALVAAVVGTLLGAGSLAGAEQAKPAPSDGAAATESAGATHLVQPGDTLWSLARRLQPDGDVRPLVARLRAAAGGGLLVPGQRIHLAA